MGISTDERLPDDQWRRLETRLLSATAEEVPGWTGLGIGDPALAIVELLAFLAEQLIWRTDVMPKPGRSRIVEVAEKLESISVGDQAGTTVSVDGKQWIQTGVLADAGPADPVFAITQDGRVIFGDGAHGRSPSGGTVSVSYRNGGGAAGNARLSLTTPWPARSSCYRLAVDPSRGIRIAEATDDTADTPPDAVAPGE